MPNLSYSTTKDRAPVIVVGYSPHILAVSNKPPVKSVDELVVDAKANPGKLDFGDTPGAITHLAGVLFARQKCIGRNHIPYRDGNIKVEWARA